MKYPFLSCIILTLIFSSEIYSQTQLKTNAQNNFPKYYLEEEKMQGICIDIIKEISKLSGITFTGYDKFLPFKRIQKNLDLGTIDIFFGIAKNEKRKKIYQFIDIPLYELNNIIVVRKDDTIDIQKLEDIKKITDSEYSSKIILTNMGTGSARFLKKIGGFKIDDQARSIQSNIEKLLRKRGRFVYFNDLSLISAIKKMKLTDKVRILPTKFRTYYHYIAFSKGTSTEVVKKIEETLQTLKETGKLKEITQKYFSLES